jgi:hypothetical protein
MKTGCCLVLEKKKQQQENREVSRVEKGREERRTARVLLKSSADGLR